MLTCFDLKQHNLLVGHVGDVFTKLSCKDVFSNHSQLLQNLNVFFTAEHPDPEKHNGNLEMEFQLLHCVSIQNAGHH